MDVDISDSEIPAPNNNVSFNNSDYVPYNQRTDTYLVPAVFGVIFLFGVIGNGTLIFTFIKNKTMRTTPNTCIISLAVGDFLVITGTVPFISTIYVFESWPYGVAVCKLSEFLKDLSVGVTALNLAILSIDRYVAIVMPIKKQTGTYPNAMTLVSTVVIWIVSAALAIPGACFAFLLELDVQENIIYICYPYPQDMFPWYPQTIVLIKFLFLYMIPLLIVGICYTLMARSLIYNSQYMIDQNERHARLLRTRIKVAKVVLAFVVVFALCFLPNQVFMMWWYFNPNAMEQYNHFWHVWKIMSSVLAFANSCLNPIALYLLSDVFRSYFRQYLLCCISSSSLRTKCQIPTKSFTSTTVAKQLPHTSNTLL
ncbi:neuropeptide CCHamide-1 receptor-like [Limulus polyphemus]|uniref:Neuropeptide CCHamide-1 receptor-like n=1 Tax=Limulus polyphemus TaxID=6850 RepID=A0ABM1AZU6_LIMPO|nr:neuropeptide CCHamide-1 receptor-like [Limulus polyphemus]